MIAVKILKQEDLYNIPVPERTSTYSPVSHGAVVEKILEEAYKNSMVLKSTNFKSNNKGTQVIGDFAFHGDNSEFDIQASFRNSYDKTMSFAFAMGNRVFICSNGMVSGEVVLKRIHRGTIVDEIDDKIVQGFETAHEVYYNNIQASNLLKGLPLDTEDINLLTGKIFLEGRMNSMQLNTLKDNLIDSKNFVTIREPGFSGWDFYNAGTEALKLSHPRTYMQDHINFHNLMVNF